MRTFSVSDVSKMLDVGEESIRRWIRDGKLNAKRAVGRGGNTLYLEDIVEFANKPPRAYLSSLMRWLEANGYEFYKNDDPKGKVSNRTKALGVGAVASSAATAASALGSVGTGALIGGGLASAVAAPIAVPVVAVAATAAALATRKNHHPYTIQVIEKVETEQEETPDVLSEEAVPAPVEETKTEEAPAVEAAPALDVIAEIERAKKLLDLEIITPEEFAAIKARLIARL